MPREKKDLTGQRFGKLIVLKEILPIQLPSRWQIICDCGTIKEALGKNLLCGNTVSCGCHRIAKHTIHNGAGSRLFNIWIGMKRRILDSKHSSYKNYGAKGITLCASWYSFIPFRKWALANGYTDNLSIDRKNTNGNYKPSNCRWATNITQSRNQIHRKHSSKYRGVQMRPNGKFTAKINVNKKLVHIGTFTTELEAGKARDQYIIDNKLINYTMNTFN